MSTAAATLTSAATPSNRRRAATRARICEAANHLFFEQGYALVTMDHIAQAADIRRSTLYLHFREKDEILAAIAQDYTAKLRPVIARLPGPAPSRQEIERWVEEFATFVSGEAEATELLVSLSHLAKAPAAALAFGNSLTEMMAQRLTAFAEAMQPGQHIAFARAMFAMDNLGWALCYHARRGQCPTSQARLSVAAENLNRVIRAGETDA
jgi:AcrR family transcriptional regulator